MILLFAVAALAAPATKADINKALTASRGQDLSVVVDILDAPTAKVSTDRGSTAIWRTYETRAVPDVVQGGGKTTFGQVDIFPLCELRVRLDGAGRVMGHSWKGLPRYCKPFAVELSRRRAARIEGIRREQAALEERLLGRSLEGLESFGEPIVDSGRPYTQVWRWEPSAKCELAITLDGNSLVTNVRLTGFSAACPYRLQVTRQRLEAQGKWDRR